jgi:G:T/U-mismatch repair DNA glycosylase
VKETHPYNECFAIPTGTCLLVIGTAPPPRFSKPRRACLPILPGDVDFYYGSKDNYLWSEIFPELYGPNFLRRSSLEDLRAAMVQFLTEKKIWMRDILQEYERRDGKKHSASDRDIVHREKYTDFQYIFENCPTIDTVVFTGRCAEKWTGQQLSIQQFIYPAPGDEIPRYKTMSVDGRHIDFHTLPSPSPGNWLYKIGDMKMYYGDVLLKRCPPG